ncbi:MAG: O-methyltransferase [Bacteroidota bacterium]
MEFLDPKLDAYIGKHTQAENEILSELNRETYIKVMQPRMLSGHVQGRILSMISNMVKPKKILEIGTYTGYSALCLSEGLPENGELHTIEVNEELEPMIKRYFEKAGIENMTTLHIGNALEIIENLGGDFDLVFIDADKTNYLNYYKSILPRVNQGGIIIADNVLWSGKVIEKSELKTDPDTAALNEFNQYVTSDDRVENVLFSDRDGLMIMRKL